MANIRFNYLYRDGGNYKKFGYVVFPNRSDLSLEEIEQAIQSKLDQGLWFFAEKWNVPDLHFDDWDDDLDHDWHEFESVELTDEQATCDPLPIF